MLHVELPNKPGLPRTPEGTMLGQSSNLRPDLCHKIVLLIDRCEATREVRAGVLRSHGVEVHVLPLTSAEHDFSGATQCLQLGIPGRTQAASRRGARIL